METLNKNEVLDEINVAVAGLTDIMTTLEETEVNKIPYKDSWTAGQLFSHITKSTEGMIKLIQQEGVDADRDPGENIPHLKKTFLDYETKMKSPAFILPEERTYEKLEAIQSLGSAFQEFNKNAKEKDLAVIIKDTPFGAYTKWEIVHFVLYHTQRHLHQMKKIHEGLRNKI